jgi:hypothetical protein
MLFTISRIRNSDYTELPLVGKDNLTRMLESKVPTALRPNAIGLPTVAFYGYTGFSWATQVPSLFKRR